VKQQRRLAGRPRALLDYHAAVAALPFTSRISTASPAKGGRQKSHHACITLRRFSIAVLRRYARSVASFTTWARDASASSRGLRLHRLPNRGMPSGSRELLRRASCDVEATPRASFETAPCRPCPGTRCRPLSHGAVLLRARLLSLPSKEVPRDRARSWALTAGTVHVFSVQLISDHSAPVTSPVRAAVRIRNRSAAAPISARLLSSTINAGNSLKSIAG